MPLRTFRSPLCLLWCAVAASALAQQPASTPVPRDPSLNHSGIQLGGQVGGPPAIQTDGQPTTLSLAAKLVNLPVLVRDKKGAIVQNLTKDDFTLTVDGHAETIRYFDKDNDLPLTVGLLVDVSGSVSNTLDAERTASSAFLEQMLTTPANRAADRAFIIQFSHSTELLQDLTSSRPKLQAAIKELGSSDPHSRPDPNDSSNGNSGGSRQHGGTTLYDAVFLSADELLSKQTGRKAIVLLTDGDDNGSKESLNHCIEAAQRADTIVYAIYFKGEDHHDSHDQQSNNRGGGFPGGGGGGGRGGGMGGGGGGMGGGGGGHRPGQSGGGDNRVDGKKVLAKITSETGGRLFEVKKQDFAGIYNQIAEELRQQYRLAFTPDKAIMDDGYHTVDLIIPKKKDFRIQTRDGYYTGK